MLVFFVIVLHCFVKINKYLKLVIFIFLLIILLLTLWIHMSLICMSEFSGIKIIGILFFKTNDCFKHYKIDYSILSQNSFFLLRKILTQFCDILLWIYLLFHWRTFKCRLKLIKSKMKKLRRRKTGCNTISCYTLYSMYLNFRMRRVHYIKNVIQEQIIL